MFVQCVCKACALYSGVVCSLIACQGCLTHPCSPVKFKLELQICQNIEGFHLLVGKVSFFFFFCAFSIVMLYNCCMFLRVYKEGNRPGPFQSQ